jgi:hypothetical protein
MAVKQIRLAHKELDSPYSGFVVRGCKGLKVLSDNATGRGLRRDKPSPSVPSPISLAFLEKEANRESKHICNCITRRPHWRHGFIATMTGNVVLESGSRRSHQRAGNESPRRFNKNFVKWIPIVVSGFAVLLALCTYLIVGTVV